MRPGCAMPTYCAVLALGLLVATAGTATAQRKYKVRVVSDPPGGTLYIDDKEAGAVGTTPFKGKLTAGPHVLVVELDGYEPAVQDIVVKKRRRQQTFKVELVEIANGTVEVEGKAGDTGTLGAAIFVDGEEKGEVPEILELPAGAHQLEIRKKGFKPYDEWIEVAKGKTVKVAVSLVPLTAAKKSKDKPKGPLAPKGTGPIASVGADVEMGFRSYSYSGPTAGMLLPIDTGAVAVFHLTADVAPFARSRNRHLQRLSLGADLALAAPIESATDDGTMTAETTWRELWLVASYALAAGKRAAIVPRIGYGQRLFTFDGAGVTGELPDVDYKQVAVGVEARMRRGKVVGSVGADWLAVLSAGPLADRFRDASASAYRLRIGGGAALRPRLHVRVRGHYSRYDHSFSSMAGDTFEAQSGADRFYGVSIGAMYQY